MNAVEATNSETQMDSLFIGNVDANNLKKQTSWIMPMAIQHRGEKITVPFRIDTGAETNVIMI